MLGMMVRIGGWDQKKKTRWRYTASNVAWAPPGVGGGSAWWYMHAWGGWVSVGNES